MDRANLTGGRGTGEAAAVASIHRIDRQIGRLLRITYMERSRAEQFRLLDGWNRRLPGYKFALHPDESWHCEPRARAIDTPDWAVFGAVLIRNGWRRVNKDENWHWQYYPELDLHRNDPASGGSAPFEENDMYEQKDRDRDEWMKNRPVNPQPTRVIRSDPAQGGNGNIVLLRLTGREFVPAAGGAANGAALLAGQPDNGDGTFWINLPGDRFQWEIDRHDALVREYLADVQGTGGGGSVVIDLTDDDVARLAKATVDEQARRLAD